MKKFLKMDVREAFKNKKVLLSAIGITLLLIGLVGATYAYYTTTLLGNKTSNVTAVTASLGEITLTQSSPTVSGVIYPGWKGTGSVTAALTKKTDVEIGYTCKVGFASYNEVTTDVQVVVKEGSTTIKTISATDLAASGGATLISHTFDNTNLVNDSFTTNYEVEFINKDEQQNDLQGKNIKVEVSCSLINDSYQFTNDNYEMLTFYEKLLSVNSIVNSDRPNLGTGVYEDTHAKVLYTTNRTETGNPVYYFSGNETSNWVKFAGDTENGYDKYISKTAVYCNDRSTNGTTASKWVDSGTTFYFGAKGRQSNPSYKCGQSNTDAMWFDADNADKLVYTGLGGVTKTPATDTYTALSNASYVLKTPAALMTADEICFAGGKWDNASQAWYYYAGDGISSATGSVKWWTISPYWFGGNGRSDEFYVYGFSDAPGYLGFHPSYYSFFCSFRNFYQSLCIVF